MPRNGTTASQMGWIREVTGYQWMVFLIAWLGWSLDNTDFNLFALVLRPAVTELLGGNPSIAEIGRVGACSAWLGCSAGRSADFVSVSLEIISAAFAPWR